MQRAPALALGESSETCKIVESPLQPAGLHILETLETADGTDLLAAGLQPKKGDVEVSIGRAADNLAFAQV